METIVETKKTEQSVTEQASSKKKKLTFMIVAVFILLCVILASVLGYIRYKKGTDKQDKGTNYDTQSTPTTSAQPTATAEPDTILDLKSIPSITQKISLKIPKGQEVLEYKLANAPSVDIQYPSFRIFDPNNLNQFNLTLGINLKYYSYKGLEYFDLKPADNFERLYRLHKPEEPDTWYYMTSIQNGCGRTSDGGFTTDYCGEPVIQVEKSGLYATAVCKAQTNDGLKKCDDIVRTIKRIIPEPPKTTITCEPNFKPYTNEFLSICVPDSSYSSINVTRRVNQDKNKMGINVAFKLPNNGTYYIQNDFQGGWGESDADPENTCKGITEKMSVMGVNGERYMARKTINDKCTDKVREVISYTQKKITYLSIISYKPEETNSMTMSEAKDLLSKIEKGFKYYIE